MNFYVFEKPQNYIMSLIENTAYEKIVGKKQYRGLVIRNPEFNDFLRDRVNPRFYDTQGSLDLQNLFDDLELAEFGSDSLKSPFLSQEIAKSWKIGEKISECFLEDFCDSVFPYNDSRDAKDTGSNLPGTDMVGYVKIDSKNLFLFGEVKTSDEDRNPPSVVYGNGGLIEQLNRIKDKPRKRMELIRWLGLKVRPMGENNVHVTAWKSACFTYYRNNEYKIFGVMLRGIKPEESDLKNIFERIVPNMDNTTYLELLALYLPISSSEYAQIMGDSH